MIIVLIMAGGAAVAVIVWNAYRDTKPDLASQAARRTQQLAAVTLCLAKAVEGVVEALALGLRPAVTPSSGPSWRSQRLVDNDAWDGEYT